MPSGSSKPGAGWSEKGLCIISLQCSRSVEAYVREIGGLIVDAPCRGRDPVGEFTGLHYTAHERGDKRPIPRRRQTWCFPLRPLRFRNDVPFRVDAHRRERTDSAIESLV